MKKRKQYNKKNQRSVGARYEQVAGKYLEEQGYQILQYNYHCRQGEIDIIARDGEYLVFCDVKYRTDRRKATARTEAESFHQLYAERMGFCGAGETGTGTERKMVKTDWGEKIGNENTDLQGSPAGI